MNRWLLLGHFQSVVVYSGYSWWRHQMETFSALLALCAGNSPVTGEFPAQRPVTQSSDVCVDLRLNKRLKKQSWDLWFETPSRSLWRHGNVLCLNHLTVMYQNVQLFIALINLPMSSRLRTFRFKGTVQDWLMRWQMYRRTSNIRRPKSQN